MEVTPLKRTKSPNAEVRLSNPRRSTNTEKGNQCILKFLIDLLYNTVPLCSRNFQNVNLRLDFVEIDYLTATQILREIKFWPI